MEKIREYSSSVRERIEKIASEIRNEVPGLETSGLFGKGARTMFAFALSDIFGVAPEKTEMVSVAAELLHTASLLHDDCIDRAVLRRGERSFYRKYGTTVSILLGDLFMTYAFQNARSVSAGLADELVYCAKNMTRGALLEESNSFRRISIETYLKINSLKTSSIFAWISSAIVFLSGKREYLNRAYSLGKNAGLLFQISDDLLDFTDSDETGKDSLKDILNGKYTLPLIMASADSGSSAFVREKMERIRKSRVPDLGAALQLADYVRNNGYLDKARKYGMKILAEAENDADSLPGTSGKDAVKGLIVSFLDRNK